MLADRRDELIAHKDGLPLRVRELDRVDTEEGAGGEALGRVDPRGQVIRQQRRSLTVQLRVGGAKCRG